jgi:creatinine amidohydrolase
MAAGEPVLLAELTWPQIQALISGGEMISVLPVGATEQHGRHLATGTDSILAEEICRAASARTGAPLLPTLWAGSSDAHTAIWPGTFSLGPRLLIDVVVGLGRWVESSGFERLLIVNAHVGNAGPLAVAVDELRSAGKLRAGVLHWFELTEEIARRVRADAVDWHAHAAETSLMLHLRPELVHREEVRDDPDRTGELVLSYTVAETSMDGTTGAPSQGSAEQGRDLFELVVAALTARIATARTEVPPISDGVDRKSADLPGASQRRE